MCQGNPVLRILGFTFLLIAILASGIGLFAPFWIRNNKTDPGGSFKINIENVADSTSVSFKGTFIGTEKEKHSDFALPSTTTTSSTPMKNKKLLITTGRVMDDDNDNMNSKKKKRQAGGESTLANIGGHIVPTPINLLADLQSTSATKYDNKWFWEGLWNKCTSNLTCICFAQDDFALEKEFPDWHKAAQGLYSLGFLIYLITLLIGGFYLCCRCCKESIKLATTLGSFTLSGIILIALALVVYGGFSFADRDVKFEGNDIVFEWGFFLAIASLGPAILAAIFYLIDGCRSTIVVEHDDCETAKMV